MNFGGDSSVDAIVVECFAFDVLNCGLDEDCVARIFCKFL